MHENKLTYTKRLNWFNAIYQLRLDWCFYFFLNWNDALDMQFIKAMHNVRSVAIGHYFQLLKFQIINKATQKYN